MRIAPLSSNVLIKPINTQQETSNGIILPDSAQEKTQSGEIVAVGDGYLDAQGILRPVKLSIGYKVVYKTWGGTEVKINNEKHILIDEKDILGVIHES